MSAQTTTTKQVDPPEAEQDAAETQAEERLRGYARYRHLRANVRKRRTGYKLFILSAILIFVVTLVDMLVLESALQWPLLGVYGLFFLWGIILLFSRKRQEEDLEEMRNLERMLLQCPDCNSVFQYGEINFHDHKKSAFSCPICGVYSTLPDVGAEPVKALAPEGDLKEFAYVCRNCNEEIRVGTFGDQPMHITKFRACPSCGEKGHIERIPLPAEDYAGGAAA